MPPPNPAGRDVAEARYLVTGASGFIGSRLCVHLKEAGKPVIGQIRGTAAPTLTRHDIPFVRTALEDLGTLQDVLAEVTHVVHVAGDPRFGNGPQYRHSNIDTTEAVINALKRSAPKLQRLVFVSTIGAVDRMPGDDCRLPLDENSRPHPTSDYGRSKQTAEQLVKASGLPFAIVRPAMVVGETMRANSHFAVFAALAVRGHPISRLDLPGTLSTIHVDDLAAALETAAEHPDAVGRTFFAAGSPARLGDVFAAVNPRRKRVPLSWTANLIRPFMRFVPFSAKVLLYPALVASDAPLRALGWTPVHDAQSALAPVIARERRRRDVNQPCQGLTVVTGAASGLGRAVALALHARGRRLLLVDRDASGLAAVLAHDPAVQRAACDLRREEDIAALLGSAPWTDAPIEELYACAGFGLRGEATRLDGIAQADLYRVNIIARVLMTRAVAPEMRERGFGRIVLISSSTAFQPLPWMAAYASSNAAILSFGEAVSQELDGTGVELFVICPGGMKTSFQARAGVKEMPNEKLMAPEDVALAILGAIDKRHLTQMVSFRSWAMSLLARLLPRRLSLALWSRLMTNMR